jgi:hypothetical protein
MRWRAAAAALLFVVIASLALNAYQYSSPRSLTVTSTSFETRFLSTPSAFNYDVSNVTIPMPDPQLQILPTFIVGNYLFNVTSYGPPCPYPQSDGGVNTMASCVRVTFTVTTTQMIPRVSQNVSFYWVGTFSAHYPPSPNNATLFNGAVRMNWFVNSSLSYLHITTKWPPVI